MSFHRKEFVSLACLFFVISSKALAAGVDAGSLDQVLKKQVEIENNAAPAESLIKKSENSRILIQ